MKVFVSWSGGKESVLACFRAIKSYNYKVKFFLNMVTQDGKFSHSHGVSSDLLKIQAQAIGISLIQRKTTWKSYEQEFKKAICYFKEKGIQAGVFGDIDLQEHRDWIEKVCKDTGIEAILPLWNKKREDILKEFIQTGFKAIVCSVNSLFLSENYLGRVINERFIEELKTQKNIDLCGERGEYHTFVYDGPIFKNPVRFKIGEKIKEIKTGFWN
ncbi:diphthine--ammonia ligase [bacterium]|nr:diphthine--ammonia ligase [bacterium]